MRVAVMGASGYAGAEVLRILASHPEVEVVLATGESAAGTRVAQHIPALAALYPDTAFSPSTDIARTDVDVAFLALPHGESQKWVPSLVERNVGVIDLGADFRLRDSRHYEQWYHGEHAAPSLLADAVYGLVERHRDELSKASLVAVPGCFPTATALALGPFCDRGVVASSDIVVNALTGVSGAGRTVSDRLHFSRLSANAEAYGLVHHRHTGEIEQELAASALFTPHLVPVARGMLITAYARVTSSLSTSSAMAILHDYYDNEPFVVVIEEPPALKDPLGSNLCFVSARVDERTGWLIAMSSLDNLVKGAAGQAVQAFNVVHGFEETTALARAGVTP